MASLLAGVGQLSQLAKLWMQLWVHRFMNIYTCQTALFQCTALYSWQTFQSAVVHSWCSWSFSLWRRQI